MQLVFAVIWPHDTLARERVLSSVDQARVGNQHGEQVIWPGKQTEAPVVLLTETSHIVLLAASTLAIASNMVCSTYWLLHLIKVPPNTTSLPYQLNAARVVTRKLPQLST